MTSKYKKYSSYKDSGVEWLGEIPEHWELGRLGTILKPISIKNRADLSLLSITREEGVIERDIENEGSNHNYIPDDLSNYKVIKKGQFGMNKMKAWQGSYGISPFTGIVSPAYYVFDFNSEINPEFFHYAVRSKKYISFFGQASDGVRIGQWDLSQTRMKEIPFFIPKYEEQTTIATFLDDKTSKIDTAIAQKQKMIALLKERKQIVIQNAVTGKWSMVDGKWAETPKEKLKDSGVEWLGEIPEGWDTVKLKFIIESRTGNAFPSIMFTLPDSDGIPVVRISDLDFDGIVKLDKCPKLPWKFSYDIESYGLRKGDILFAMTGGTIGKVAQFTGDDTALLNQRVCSFRIDDETTRRFILHWVNTSIWREYINLNSSGGAQPNISDVDVLNLRITFPPLSEQTTIATFLDNKTSKIDRAISLQQSQIEKLKEYKATLIDSAVTGKIRVSG